MDTFQIAILGIVQGLTEFLPISSSAHLTLFPQLLGWEDPGLDVDAFLHLGTLLAVLIYFGQDIWHILTHHRKRRLLIALALATLPVVIVGFSFKSFFQHSEFIRSMEFIGFTLCIGGVLLAVADKLSKKKYVVEELNLVKIFFIGCMQVLALFPGMSRSGTTIAAALFTNLTRKEAARFSFLLGVPAIGGAGLLAVKDMFSHYSSNGIGFNSLIETGELIPLIVGFITSFISGWFAIDFLIKFLQKHSVILFVVYRVLFGLGLVIYGLI